MNMDIQDIPPRLTISEAIRLSKVSRATFYRNYLATGKISFKVGTDKKKYIELAELLRVCPDITMDKEDTSAAVLSDNLRLSELNAKIERLELELRLTREQLMDARDQIRKADDREVDLRNLLVQAKGFEQKKIGWWGRLTKKY